MKTTVELWSQFAFRISAFTLAALLVVLTIRDQNRPEDVDLQDTRYLQKMESYIKTEMSHETRAKPQIADDQRGFRATPHGIRSQKPSGACIRS
jgi:hypothetical protein